MIWEILVIILLVILNGFFAMSEIAIVSSRRARLQQMADSRDGNGARSALRLADDPATFLSTVQVGITLVGIVAGAYGGATLAVPLGEFLGEQFPWVVPYGDDVGFVLVVALITFSSLIIGELVPKRMALVNPEVIASRVSPFMRGLSRVAAPVVWLLGFSTNTVLKALRVPIDREQTVTEEEVKSLIKEGTMSGVFEPAERQMIEGIFGLSDRTVRSLMTPRPDIVWLDSADPTDAVAREIHESGYSRFLVCHGDVDDFHGIVTTKALLDQALNGRPFDLIAVAVAPLVVHDGTPVFRMLELFKQAKIHMAVVVDEYGSVEGLVTVTDILEAIAGELPHSGDDEQAGIVQRADGSWLVDGMTPIEDVENLLGMRAMKGDGDFHTLAGFMLDQFGYLPRAAEHFEWHGLCFEVVDMDGRRIDKVLIRDGDANKGVDLT